MTRISSRKIVCHVNNAKMEIKMGLERFMRQEIRVFANAGVIFGERGRTTFRFSCKWAGIFRAHVYSFGKART